MLAVEIVFPTGRFHATPWGRHVNEADVEWPPSPWRLIRAVIATWHRKLDVAQHPERVLESLVEKLSAELPAYRLPAAVRSHSRHYMPMREGKKDKPVLIFDAFARIAKDDPLYVVWKSVQLDEDERALATAAMEALGFLGRSESLVAARVIDAVPLDGLNCSASDLSLDPQTGEMHEPVTLLAPQPDYRAWRDATVEGIDWKALKPKQRRELEATLPEALIGALRLDTSDIKRVGWSAPPGGRFITYQRPYPCFVPQPRHAAKAIEPSAVSTVRLLLAGKPLPRIEDSVRIGELMRDALMHACERALGQVPPSVSGHGLGSAGRHRHAFYLPEDADGDGRIDHLIVHAELGLADVLPVFERLTRLFRGADGEWQLMVDGYGRPEQFVGNHYLGTGRVWESVSPYLHPWFAKKRFGYVEQIQRECRSRGLGEPQVELLPSISGARDRRHRAVHFHRFRKKNGLTQPDRRGSFVRLTFPEPVSGPLALGFGCHFGLGCFRCLDTTGAAAEHG